MALLMLRIKKIPIEPMKDSDGLSKLAAVMMEGFKNMQHSLENLPPTIAQFVTEEF